MAPLSMLAAVPCPIVNSLVTKTRRLLSAASRKLGNVEQAKDGTLFLDEIGEMTLETQGKILRLLAGRTFERIGGKAQTRL